MTNDTLLLKNLILDGIAIVEIFVENIHLVAVCSEEGWK